MSKKGHENFTDQHFDYYVRKFQRRVFRRLVEYRVLADNLKHDLKRVGHEVTRTLGMDHTLVDGVEVKDHVEKACLTGLKAEFELFFTIYCNLVLDHLLSEIESHQRLPEDHKGLLDVIKNKKSFFDDFVRAGFKDARQLFIAQAVPSHGLDRLSDLLTTCGWRAFDGVTEGCGKDLGEAFEGVVVSPWDQIQTAFQVRHAIEHAFSHVGPSFEHKTKTIWRQSSWRRHFGEGGPKRGTRIPLDRVDIEATAAAMTWVARTLEDTLPKGDAP